MTDVAISLQVNGRPVEASIEPRLTLAGLLRRQLRLTGTHLGCEHGVCGACTVIVDGAAVRSCLMFAAQADGAEVVTVEGLAPGEDLSHLQQAFRRNHALQCGFCTPGILLSATHFLRKNAAPSEAEVRDMLSGHICRCTGYAGIVAAIMDAAERLRRGE